MKRSRSKPKSKLPLLPLRRAQLPRTEKLIPYLRRIDRNNWYSNFGELATEFEIRIAAHFDVEPDQVTAVANATLGLVAALQAQKPVGKRCIVPSFTFAASPAAAILAGLEPYFIDVDSATWALNPGDVERKISDGLTNVGAVMPVSPFGDALDTKAWDAFAERTGIPVVLDAAWAFDTLDAGSAPAVISLHATKVLGIGEGGLVISRRPDLIRRVRQLSNFGFNKHSASEMPGGNAKISEYAAAVGHAALDEWPARRRKMLAVNKKYRAALSGIDGVQLRKSFDEYAGATCAVKIDMPVGPPEIAALRERGIEARLWWGQPCHTHPAYERFGSEALPITEQLACRVLCLPFYAELTAADILRVREAVIDVFT